MSEHERLLGLDVGEARIGVAVSEASLSIAFPHSVIQCAGAEADIAAVKHLVEETDARRVIVGLPLNQHGQPGPQAEKVLGFVEGLREALSCQVETIDERFTTAIAHRALRATNVKGKDRKKVVDAVAAQQILQTYLDRRQRAGST